MTSLRYARIVQREPLSTLPIATQTAIQLLREQGFIWQSSCGADALEDESFAEWFSKGTNNKKRENKK